jgi:predicted nicotinamide N-methyase
VRRKRDVVEQRVEVGAGSLVLTRPGDPDALLAEATGDAPYWAVVWPSAVALAEVLARDDVEGLHVLELGCGLGLPSLAAAVRGARVLATDVVPEALDYVRESARRLGVPIETLLVDVADPPGALLDRAPFDLVLVADLLYEGPLATAVADLIARLLGPTSQVLVAYPWADQGPALTIRLLTAVPALELETTEHRIAGFRTDDRSPVAVLRGTLPA